MNKYDEWRAKYDKMNHIDQIYYAISFIDNGKDQSETRHQLMSKELSEFIAKFPGRAFHIVELGGWEGYLANELLNNFKIKDIYNWINFDIALNAIIRNKCIDPRYDCIITHKPIWLIDNSVTRLALDKANLFIASHCLEHIKYEELTHLYHRLIDSNIDYCFLDIPISDTPSNWTNYEGTHILEVGYLEIIELFSNHFELVKRNNTFTLWRRKY